MNYSPGNFGIVIFIYVRFTSLKIVYPQSIILSQQGVIFRIPISDNSTLSTTKRLLSKSKFSP